MKPTNGVITQVCIVVHNVQQANANWAKLLGLPPQPIETIFSDGILHHTNGQSAEYRDCQVAKYELDQFVIELMQPGPTPSPWRTFLEKHGQGVFHFCFMVKDRAGTQKMLGELGVGLPYHIGYYPGGSYSYVASEPQLGIELSINHHDGNEQLFKDLLAGIVKPLDELKG